MSSQAALAQQIVELPCTAGSPVLDLCAPIYLRNFALHQAAQESINSQWGSLLQGNG